MLSAFIATIVLCISVYQNTYTILNQLYHCIKNARNQKLTLDLSTYLDDFM